MGSLSVGFLSESGGFHALPNSSLLNSSFFACSRGCLPFDLIHRFSLDHHRVRLFVNLDRNARPIPDGLLRPEAGIQSVQPTDQPRSASTQIFIDSNHSAGGESVHRLTQSEICSGKRGLYFVFEARLLPGWPTR
jgi:hypothetical protein